MAAYLDSLDKRAGFDEICDIVAVTPSDIATTLNACMNNKIAQRLYVGGSGHVVLILESNTALNDAGGGGHVTLQNVIAGNWIKIPPTKRIAATGTTATGILIGVLF
jgi:hypothetical protein